MHRFFYALLCALAVSVARAADAVPLSIDQLFKLVEEHSKQIKLANLAVDAATAEIAVSEIQRLPSLTSSLSVGYLGNGYLTDRNFSNGMGIRNPHFTTNFAIEAMQVIYSGGAITEGINMARLKQQMAQLDLQENSLAAKFVLLGQLITLYQSINNQQTLTENIALAYNVLENTRQRYDQGLALLSDVTRYELQIETLTLQLRAADEHRNVANYQLATTLDFNPSATAFAPEIDKTLIDAPEMDNPLSYWQEIANANSITLRKTNKALEINDAAINLIKAERRPSVGVAAYGHFDGPITIEVPVLNKNFMYWGFGINVSYKLSSLYTTKRKLSQALAQRLETEQAHDVAQENVMNQIQRAQEQLLTAKVKLNTCRKSLELAQQNYAIVSERYDNGIALVTDMVDAANVKLSAQLDLDSAEANIIYYYYQLKYLSCNL